jgi:hypothetical protein
MVPSAERERYAEVAYPFHVPEFLELHPVDRLDVFEIEELRDHSAGFLRVSRCALVTRRADSRTRAL